MTAQYHVLPSADRDLDEQAAYLASEASLDTALRFYDAAAVTLPEFSTRKTRSDGAVPGDSQARQSMIRSPSSLAAWRPKRLADAARSSKVICQRRSVATQPSPR